MKILNFGSLNLDYVYEVAHLVKPGETISADKLTANTGGKGLNQSIALAKAGARVFHAGAIGAADVEMLKGTLEKNGVNTDYVKILPGPSGHAIIQVDRDGRNSIVIFGGANQQIDREFVDMVLAGFEAGDIVLLQNEISSIGYIMDKAYSKGMKIYLNPSPANSMLSGYPIKYADTLILNEVEGEQLAGVKEPERILDTLLSMYPEMKIVLTLGENGSVYADKDCRISREIYRNKVVDTTAAGDTFTGYFMAGVSNGEDISTSLKHASAAASISVSRLGAACAIPSMEEVEEFIENY
ncbi:MAG TPA: ribokinase, partial [Negativicutes bacterium]|nr:ribokinase [Negativicutes bacterium]